MSEAFNQISHFLTNATAMLVAVLIISVLIAIVRKIAPGSPVEIGELENVLPRAHEVEGSSHQVKTVNVELRSADASPLDFGAFVSVTMNNGHGNLYTAKHGTFIGCDAAWFHAGATVTLLYQGGLVREKVKIQLDIENQALFIQSRFSKSQLLRTLNGKAGRNVSRRSG